MLLTRSDLDWLLRNTEGRNTSPEEKAETQGDLVDGGHGGILGGDAPWLRWHSGSFFQNRGAQQHRLRLASSSSSFILPTPAKGPLEARSPQDSPRHFFRKGSHGRVSSGTLERLEDPGPFTAASWLCIRWTERDLAHEV